MNKHNFKDWLIATRPWSFPASAMPVLVTLAYLFWCNYSVNWAIGIWALINIVIFHAAGNTWSDYYDFKKGVDREDTIGGMSITSGQFTPNEIRRLAIILLIIAITGGCALILLTGLPLLYIGIAGALLTMFYPWLKYHALGDIDIFLTYSLLPILGTSYATTGAFRYETLWLTIPIGLITVGILHSNNTRDTEHDKRANIKTFAMLIGGRASTILYLLEVLLPFVWVIAGIIEGIFPIISLLTLIALKPAIDNARKALKYIRVGAKALHGMDEATAKLQLIFSLLFTISLFIAALI
ncbi:MAG: prenyltransferase [Bacteroidaceae bacterium]|nr:prenyltransferase [Bacteroidaceae bacterium]